MERLYRRVLCVIFAVGAVALANISTVTASNIRFTEEKISAFKEIGEKIKNSVNENIDPCMDYNGYICGHFDEDKIISKSEIVTNEFFDDDELEKILTRFLPKPEDMTETEVKMTKFLTSCNNKKDEDINKFIRDYRFSDAIGGWPAFTPNWDENKFDLVAATAELTLIANSILIDVVFKEKGENFAIKISPKRIYVPQYEDTLNENLDVMKNLLRKYGVANVEEVSGDVVLFEKEYSTVISFDISEELLETDFQDLKKKLPEFDWDKYFEILLDKRLPDSTSVIIDNIEGLRKLLSKVKSMEPKVVANYFFYLFVRQMDIEFGTRDSCYNRLFLHFESVISKLVVKNLYDDSYKTYLLDMVRAVIDTMKESLHDFDGKSTEDIMNKIQNFLDNEYLPSLTEERISEVYSKIEIDPSNFYGNTLKFFRHYVKLWLQSFQGGKNIGMKTINRRMLSYIFIRSIYEYYRKPSPIVFDFIATPLLRKSLNILAPGEDYEDSVKECFRKQLNISQEIRHVDLVSVKAVQVYMKSFDKWAEKHPELIAAENEIFSEFGLTDKKILFAIHVQSSCRYKEMNDQSYLRKLFFSALPNTKDFTNEYNCPPGSPMHPKVQCEIP